MGQRDLSTMCLTKLITSNNKYKINFIFSVTLSRSKKKKSNVKPNKAVVRHMLSLPEVCAASATILLKLTALSQTNSKRLHSSSLPLTC